MAVRGSNREAIKDNVKSIQKETRKAYVYWAVGIMISALGLKPSSISAVGFALTIEHPEIIQGVLYLAALYQAITALLMLQKRAESLQQTGRTASMHIRGAPERYQKLSR